MSLVNTETGEITESLTDIEAARFRVKEHAIERGAQSIGEALRDIRNERLYRETHATFEDYCRERWGIGRDYADKQIMAVEIAAVLPTNVGIRESHARELAPLRGEPERMREVWAEANEATDGKPTAAAIRVAREPALTPEPLQVTRERSDKPRAAPRRAITDQFFDAAYDVTKKVESLRRIVGDDRFPQNAEKVAAKHRNDLLRTRDLLEQVINALPEQESTQ